MASQSSPTASLPRPSTNDPQSDIPEERPPGAVDAWSFALNAAKTADDSDWQPASPDPWPEEDPPPASQPGSPRDMPGIGDALQQGLFHGGRELMQGRAALSGRLPEAADQSPAAAPLQWSDLLSPERILAPKLAYQLGASAPTMAGGVVGAAIGSFVAGGLADPLSAITGTVGGAVGAALVSGLQSFGNYFGEELRRTPADPEAAYGRALGRAMVAGTFTGAAWAAVPARAFQGPLKHMLFQAFGVQPGINMGHQAADNALTGQPLTEGLPDAYAHGALGTITVAGGHHFGSVFGELLNHYELHVDPNVLAANHIHVRLVPKVKTRGIPEAQLTEKGLSHPVPLTPRELAGVNSASQLRNRFLKTWREADVSSFPAETRRLLWRGRSDNAVRKNLTPDDLAATMKEEREVVILKPDGLTPYKHRLVEWPEAQRSITKTISFIQQRLYDLSGSYGSYEYNILLSKLSDFSKLLDKYEDVKNGR